MIYHCYLTDGKGSTQLYCRKCSYLENKVQNKGRFRIINFYHLGTLKSSHQILSQEVSHI